MNVIIFGPPGSGKGTQARMIEERYGVPHISTGDIFRAAIENKTEIGLQIKEILARGQLAPDELTIKLVQMRLNDVDCTEGFVLDGFPRTINQAEALDEMAEIGFVIVLNVPDDVIVERISKRRTCAKCQKPTTKDEGDKCKECGGELVQRDDQDPETVKQRLTVYADQTAPLLEYYKPRDLVHVIDGNRPIESIFEDIIKILGESAL